MSGETIKHVGIFGVGMTGKSTLLRRFSRAGVREQFIYDPTRADSDWHDGWRPDCNRFFSFGDDATKRTHMFENPHTFYKAASKAQNADIFIDEAADIFNHKFIDYHRLIMVGRHQGLRIFIASQRPNQVAPGVRSQCMAMFIFRLGHDDLRSCMSNAGFNIKDLPCRAPLAQGEMFTIDCVNGKMHSGFKNVTDDKGL